MKKNSFNQDVPEIKDLFKDPKIEDAIRATLSSVLDYLGISNTKEVIDFTIKHAKEYSRLQDYERIVHDLFDERRITQRIPLKLSNRADLIFSQIRDYLKGHQILDLGCGDGKVGELIASKGRHVILSDVYEHGNLSNLKTPFIKIKQNGKLPFQNNMFDTTLLLTVLHHSDNPKEVISEARRVTKKDGRIIVIESVYGVKKYGKGLNEEQQRFVNIFFDHFYNRVIHYNKFKKNKVNVPFNFKTPQNWKAFFEKERLYTEKLIHLGFDQPTVPEYHTLHILEVKK